MHIPAEIMYCIVLMMNSITHVAKKPRVPSSVLSTMPDATSLQDAIFVKNSLASAEIHRCHCESQRIKITRLTLIETN